MLGGAGPWRIRQGQPRLVACAPSCQPPVHSAPQWGADARETEALAEALYWQKLHIALQWQTVVVLAPTRLGFKRFTPILIIIVLPSKPVGVAIADPHQYFLALRKGQYKQDRGAAFDMLHLVLANRRIMMNGTPTR